LLQGVLLIEWIELMGEMRKIGLEARFRASALMALTSMLTMRILPHFGAHSVAATECTGIQASSVRAREPAGIAGAP
jgi:hypothetical protein